MGQDQLRSCGGLQLKAANGLDIPYRGYLEWDVEVLGNVFPSMGILVVQDPPDSAVKTKKDITPGLVGMNVLQCCLQEMFCQAGTRLFTPSSIPSVAASWRHALLACQSFEDPSESGQLGRVSTPPGFSVHVPAGSMKLVSAVCRQGICSLVQFTFLEPGEGEWQLLPDLITPSCLFSIGDGTVCMPVVNVGMQDQWIRPHTTLGQLHMIMVCPVNKPVCFQEEEGTRGPAVLIQAVEVTASQLPGLAEMSWPGLTDSEQQQAKSLLQRYTAAFSCGE